MVEDLGVGQFRSAVNYPKTRHHISKAHSHSSVDSNQIVNAEDALEIFN